MKIKRIIAIVLSCVMLSGILPAFAQDNDEVNKSSLEKLIAFGILDENDDLLYEKTMSRGSFVRYSARLLGNMEAAVVENPYTDVSVQDDCYSEVMLFYSLGYIGGAEQFRPMDDITLPEASKILLGILGYSKVAEAKGYPAGYTSLAHRFDLFNNTKNTADSISVANFIEILLNVLETPVLDVDAVVKSDDDLLVHYTNKNTKTLLERNFSIYKIEGIMETNEYTSIYGAYSNSDGFVTINENTFAVGKTNADELLGYYAEAYYLDENAGYELVYAAPDSRRNDVVSIMGKNVTSASLTQIKYYDEQNKSSVKKNIEPSASMIYNGGFIKFDKTLLEKNGAHITLIDNDADNKAEIVSVMEYRTIIVASVSSDFIISDELGGTTIEIDPENNDYDLKIISKEGSIKPNDIEKGDVISYAVPQGSVPNIKYLFVSRNYVSGKITQMNEDGLWIEDSFYNTDKSVLSSAVLGRVGTFSLDYFGEIVYKKIERDMVYGWINEMYKDRRNIQVKIFTENNRWGELNFAKKFSFNGIKTEADSFFDTYGAHPEKYRQLVTYRVNDNAEIIELNFAKTSPSWSNEEKMLIDNDVFRLSAQSEQEAYRTTITSLGNRILLKSSTLLFMIPEQESNEIADEENFYIASRDDLIGDRNYYNIYAYDSDEMGQAEVCVLIGNATTVNSNSKFLILNKLRVGITDNGEETYSLCGMYAGAEMSIQTRDKAIVDSMGGLNPGDVIQISYDNDGYVTNIKRLYSSTSGFEQKFISGSLWASTTICAGRVVRNNSSINRIAVDYGTDTAIFGTNNITNVYVYHTQTEEVEKISAKDLHPDDYIVTLVRYFAMSQAVVFRP